MEAGEGALVVLLVVEVALGCPDAAVETRLRAAVIAGCKESFRLEAASRTGAAAAVDDGCLPGQRKYNKAYYFLSNENYKKKNGYIKRSHLPTWQH